MSRPNVAGGVAGLCFLACGLIVVLAYAMTAIRVYGPAVREWLHWLVNPQFAIGMFFMAFLVCAGAFCVGMGDRR